MRVGYVCLLALVLLACLFTGSYAEACYPGAAVFAGYGGCGAAVYDAGCGVPAAFYGGPTIYDFRAAGLVSNRAFVRSRSVVLAPVAVAPRVDVNVAVQRRFFGRTAVRVNTRVFR